MQVQEKLSQQSTARTLPFGEKSLLFAPMEGITDIHYRETILENYPEWDFVSTDFLRAPSVGPYPPKHVLKHYGKSSYEDLEKRRKTIYQMLTTEDALTEDTVSKIRGFGFKWLDLNLGCPSKTVCKHRGGSFLLSELKALRKVIRTIRSNFPETFTAKIRVGYKDDTLFKDILMLLEDEGVDAITIHARTRDEMYKGVAKWEYVKTAVETVKTPIVGNGDIWTVDDIKKYFEYTKCHSVMIARGALKTPWLARLYKDGQQDNQALRVQEIQRYFNSYFQRIDKLDMEELKKIRRLKAISRYIFDDLDDGDQKKRAFLLSKTREQMFGVLESL
ncbi:MAG: tRNA-dihydrouridine synthase family protein [Bacteriovoracaceae bacterium]|nr:tRNA-dihydrouridine synthase family protein [Bacteriovoracaceae bacterium]